MNTQNLQRSKLLLILTSLCLSFLLLTLSLALIANPVRAQADPDLFINKWNTNGYARPGGVFVYGIYYRNQGSGVASNTIIVDTLPASTTYAGDTSGVAPIVSGGVITWNLGNIDPEERDVFFVTVNVMPTVLTGSQVITRNCVAISTSANDSDPGNNNACADPVDVWDDEVELSIEKWVNPSDPAPGQKFVYGFNWCNNRGAAAGPALLTDTLPASTTLVSWQPEQWWQKYWTEVSTSGGKLVLQAPGLPGDECRQIDLTLLLNPNAPMGQMLINHIAITSTSAGDADPNNNQDANTNAHVGSPRYDMTLNKTVHANVLVPGGWINYFIEYSNQGNMLASVWITDDMPAGLSFDSAQWGGGQPNAGDPITPTVVGSQLIFDSNDLGEISVAGNRWFHIQMNITNTITPGTVITNCAAIGITATENTPTDNTDCYSVTILNNGPNLRVTKNHNWQDDNSRLEYEVYFENIGDQTIPNVWITDTLPLSTSWGGWWDYSTNFDWDSRLISETQSAAILRWNLDYLDPGDFGYLRFDANLDAPGVLFSWFTNTVQITQPATDTVPADNTYQDKAFISGEVDYVGINVGETHIWGDVPDGPITITTLYDQATLPNGGHFDWDFNEPFQPGEVVTVTAGSGRLPVVIHIPAPFSVTASSLTNTVWGQIDALNHKLVTVRLNGYGEKTVQTDASGNYSATFPTIPRNGEGYVSYQTQISYADVAFERHYRTQDLILNINYGHDWIEGSYEPGHTVTLTVTAGDGSTIKGRAVLTTGPIPDWGGQSGFATYQGDPWDYRGQPDIQAGDWVYGLLDNGYTSTAHLGTINGQLDIAADAISGTIAANWFSQSLNGRCEIWEENAPEGKNFTFNPNNGPYFCNFSGEWDLLPGQTVGVSYWEPDGDHVINTLEYPAPRVRIEKWADGNPAEGSNFSFYIQYRNEGDAPAENVVVTDTMLSGLTYLTDTSGLAHSGSNPVAWQVGTLPANSQAQFQVFAAVTAFQGQTVTNTAEISTTSPYNSSSPEDLYREWNGQVQANDTQLNVGKNPWTDDPAPNTNFVWAINVCNNGSTDSAQVLVTDTIPISTSLVEWWADSSAWTEVFSNGAELAVSCPSIPGNRCQDVYLRLHLNAAAQPGMNISNTVIITAANDTNGNDNTAESWVNVNNPHTNLSLDKWWNRGQLIPDGQIAYGISYNNNGNVPITSTLYITDVLPVSTSFNSAWRSDQFGEHPVTPTLVTADYVVWQLNGLQNGESGNFEVRLDVDSNAPPGLILTNTAQITLLPNEDNNDDNSDTITQTLYNHGPNLRVRKYGNWNDWGENTRQTRYNIAVENIGSVSINHVTITDTYPTAMNMDGGLNVNYWGWWEWQDHPAEHYFTATFQRLDPGNSVWIEFNAIVPGGGPLPFGQIYTNTVKVMPVPNDVNPADNSDYAVLTTGPDLYVEKTLAGGDFLPGEAITFSLRFGNNREGHEWWWNMQGNAWLTDTLPAQFEYITSTQHWCGPGGDWCARPPDHEDGNKLIWELWPIEAGGENEIRLTVRITDTAEGDDTFTNWAEIASDQPISDTEAIYSNNSDSYNVPIALPVFTVSKRYASSRIAGTLVTYTLSVTNSGHAAGTNVVLSDTIPSGLSYGGGGSLVISDVTWLFTSIAPVSGTASGWFNAVLPCAAGQNVTNNAYQVVGSNEGVSSSMGSAVSFNTLTPTISVNITHTTGTVLVNSTVNFTATASTDGATLNYTWNFGDGGTAAGLTATHAYTQDGKYTIVFTAADSCTYSKTATRLLTVTKAQTTVYLPIVLKN